MAKMTAFVLRTGGEVKNSAPAAETMRSYAFARRFSASYCVFVIVTVALLKRVLQKKPSAQFQSNFLNLLPRAACDAEVAVGGRVAINRTAEVEAFDNRARAEVVILRYDTCEVLSFVVEGFHHDG